MNDLIIIGKGIAATIVITIIVHILSTGVGKAICYLSLLVLFYWVVGFLVSAYI